MSEIYDIEKIVNHRIKDGELQYNVKWKGYDSTNNTWEPRKNFLSEKIIHDYHVRMKERKIEEAKKQHAEAPRMVILSDEAIRAARLRPIKVQNIHHQHGNEKSLVAVVQFLCEDDTKETAFVPAEWANMHCPSMVIQFYESRILWKNRHTNELTKCIFTN